MAATLSMKSVALQRPTRQAGGVQYAGLAANVRPWQCIWNWVRKA